MGELRLVNPIPEVIARRAAERYTVAANGCWVSDYMRNALGYHVLSHKVDDKTTIYLAHRAAYTFHRGPIPGQLVVDHTCHNRSCVNPAHLRLLTRDENARRHKGTADFPLGQCPNGHPLSEQRKRLKGVTAGYGYCGACQKIRNDALSARRKQARSSSGKESNG